MNSGKKILVLTCCVVFGALAFWQHSVARKEIMVYQLIRSEQERHHEMLSAARARPQALEDTIAETEQQLDNKRRALPAEMDVDGLLIGLDECLATYRIELCGSSTEIRDRDFYREADLVLELCGSEAERVALAAEPQPVQRCADPRLARLSRVEMVGDRLRAVMTVYSHIASESPPHKNWCDRERWPVVESWQWPFAGRARAARVQLEELCPEMEQHRAALERVLDLRDLRETNERMRHVIDALVANGAGNN